MTRENTKLYNVRLCTRNVHSVCSCVSSVTEFCSFVQTKKRRKRKKKTKIFQQQLSTVLKKKLLIQIGTNPLSFVSSHFIFAVRAGETERFFV